MTILEELRWKKFPVLNDGFVSLVDVMGDDLSIVQAARVSFGAGTKSVSDDRTLIRYLMRNQHSTPFEMAEIKILVRVPMDCWRQWIRHRTANVNEYSTRYSDAIDSCQETDPDEWRLQSTANKQGSGGFLGEWTGPDHLPNPSNESPEHSLDHQARVVGKVPSYASLSPGKALSIVEFNFHRQARDVYEQRLAIGVAREQARKDLPLSTYTEAYWKCDLRNVLGFLALRMDPHAQQEIREYANIIGNEIVKPLFPLTWGAFEEYSLGSLRLSATEVTLISKISSLGYDINQITRELEYCFSNKRERDDCRAKLVRLKIIRDDD